MNVRTQSAAETAASLDDARDEIARKVLPPAPDDAIEFSAKAAISALSPEDPRKHPASKLKRPPSLGETLVVGSKPRKSFDRICCDGDPCDPYVLSGFLYLAGFDWSFSDPLSVWQMAGVSRKAVEGLPDELERLASKIKSVSPVLELYWRTVLPGCPEQVRSAARVMPHLLVELAKNVKNITVWLDKNVGPKRVDSRRLSLLQLLRYVRSTTKKPHFADVACVLGYVVSQNDELLLKHLALVTRKVQGRPFKELPTAAMLKQVWHRAAKYNLLPR